MLSERPITRGDILTRVNVVGGIPMLDGGQADDKIIGIIVKDAVWGGVQDISELPELLVDRLAHYFATYKSKPGTETDVFIGKPYGRSHAESVVLAAMRDYEREFGMRG